ncbi:MAG: type II CAAX endopeptidase family protein [Gammaproteobacteria bacterium]|nr:type II CAAX endopeptidase family protein [Gammaproteobacteria bacterium]
MTDSKRSIELIVVFFPAVLAILFVVPLVGTDAIAFQAVIWVTYVVMLATLYAALRMRGNNWSHLGVSFQFAGWRKVGVTLRQALIVFVCAVIAFGLGSVIGANIVGIPEGADFQSYEYLQGNLGMLLLSLAGVYVVSSFGEEVLFRGYLMTRCAEFFSDQKLGNRIAILISTVVFALIHYDWGVMGILQTGCMGFVLAYAYLRVHRNLWVNIIAHGFMDTILFVQLYLA